MASLKIWLGLVYIIFPTNTSNKKAKKRTPIDLKESKND
jgi:hypothetical protein